MQFDNFLESEQCSKDFIEDVVMSSAISNTTDNPANPVRHPKPKDSKDQNKIVDIK